MKIIAFNLANAKDRLEKQKKNETAVVKDRELLTEE